jgi:glycosyltransferase involved in cell wall biosynthesis
VRIGICAYWFNRGQGVVARQLRSVLDSLGHDTFVLARPTRAKNIKPSFVDHSGVWDQPNVTDASAYKIPPDELVAWGREHDLDLALFDQNYEFEAIAALREAGVPTAGRFVWEQFSAEDVEPAKRALEVVYSLTACERERYATMGIESPRVRWGIHPDLLGYAKDGSNSGASSASRPGAPGGDPAGVCFFYPAGFLSKRKPVEEIVKAFRRFDDPDATLVIKGQVERELKTLERAAVRDPRVEVVLADLPTDEHLRRFAAADVCVAPSRWEGLGLHLYESMALGLPVITNDFPPMNEVIRNGENGLLVASRNRGHATSGIPAQKLSVRDLTRALREVAEPGRLEQLRAGVERARERLAWEHTVGDYAELVGRFG